MDFNIESDFGTTDVVFHSNNDFSDNIDRSIIEPVFESYEIENRLKDDMFDLIKKKYKQDELVNRQTDGEYYCVLTFQSKTQRNKFLDALNIKHLLWDRYFINGLKASEILGIEQDRIELSKARFKKNFTNNYI